MADHWFEGFSTAGYIETSFFFGNLVYRNIVGKAQFSKQLNISLTVIQIYSPHVSSGIGGQRRPRSACASAQSDQGLHCPLTESFDTIKRIIGAQMPG